MRGKELKAMNPFYPLLVVVGIVFCVTACAYGVMTVKGLRPEVATATSAAQQNMLIWLDANGFKTMMIELAVLAVVTVAAIGTDEFWEKRQTAESQHDEQPKAAIKDKST